MFSKKEKKPICPFLNKPCIEKECILFVNVIGKHPQTGKDIDMWDCSFKIHNLLLMEHGRQLEGLRIVSEESRNQTVKTAENLLKAAYLFNKGMTLVDYATGEKVENMHQVNLLKNEGEKNNE